MIWNVSLCEIQCATVIFSSHSSEIRNDVSLKLQPVVPCVVSQQIPLLPNCLIRCFWMISKKSSFSNQFSLSGWLATWKTIHWSIHLHSILQSKKKRSFWLFISWSFCYLCNVSIVKDFFMFLMSWSPIRCFCKVWSPTVFLIVSRMFSQETPCCNFAAISLRYFCVT